MVSNSVAKIICVASIFKTKVMIRAKVRALGNGVGKSVIDRKKFAAVTQLLIKTCCRNELQSFKFKLGRIQIQSNFRMNESTFDRLPKDKKLIGAKVVG